MTVMNSGSTPDDPFLHRAIHHKTSLPVLVQIFSIYPALTCTFPLKAMVSAGFQSKQLSQLTDLENDLHSFQWEYTK